MLKNYFKLTIRHLLKYRTYSFINIAGLALVIALLTVSTQAIKAALTNPVETLRYE